MTLQTSQQFIYCPYTGIKLSAVAARNCNYCNLETYICSHSGEFCVAKEGLEEFAQSLTEDLPVKALEVFQKIREDLELEKRKKIYKKIADMAKHLK